MTTRQTSLVSGLMLMGLALIFSAVLVFGLSVVSDGLSGVQREMGPAVGFLFVPILALPVIALACVVHVVANKWFVYQTWRDWVSAGVLYALIFLAFTSLWLLVIPLVVNPITVAWWSKREQRSLHK
jgi:hypothetical protein